MFVSTGVLPVDALAESNIPVADVALEAMGEWGSLMMVLGAVLATVSSANASILSAARVNYAMGRDKLFSGWLNEIHSTFHTPYRAIWLTGGIILAMIALGVGIETLADVASFAYLVTYALVHVAVIVMRRADPPEYDPDFRISGAFYPLIPFVGILSTLVILAQMRPLILGIGTGVVGVGVAWYIGYARFHAREISLIGEAIMADTYDETEEEGYKVVVPVANPESERTLLKLAAACARDHDSPQLIAVNVLEVPPQTALSQDVEYEKERVRRQQQLLDQASEIAESLGVSLKTEAVVARDVASAILDVVEREKPDRVMLGWTGKRKRSDFIFGSHVDRIIEGVACEISLVKTSREDIGDVVALAGGGPTSGLAARQAYEIAMSDPESSLTLLNARVTESDNDRDSEEEYQKLRETAEAANIPEDAYEMEVATGTDIEDILIKAVRPFGTICIGATRDGILKQAIQGSLPQKIAEKASGNIFMVNESHRPRTIREAVIETLLREEE
jgi:nucleotide-binding universal stress UspA family protein